MMKFDLFVEVVKEKIKDYLPKEYQDAKVSSQETKKVNQELTVLTIFSKDQPTVAPSIYLDKLYDDYMAGENLDMILNQIADVYVKGMEQVPENEAINQLKEGNIDQGKIYYQLINTEQNRELLSGIPSREFNDMSVIYRVLLSNGEDGISSVLVNDALMARKNLTEEDLFKVATENTPKLFPITISSMNDVLRNMMANDFGTDAMYDEEFNQVMDQMLSQEVPLMYVVSNSSGLHGASTLLYEDGLGKLADQLKEDLYILPSSIHETIAVPVSTGGQSPEQLAEMVKEVNGTQVMLSDRLSNNVYYFDKETREITMATDVPERRLDQYEVQSRAI